MIEEDRLDLSVYLCVGIRKLFQQCTVSSTVVSGNLSTQCSVKATSQSRIEIDKHMHFFYSMQLPILITRWHPCISKEIFLLEVTELEDF